MPEHRLGGGTGIGSGSGAIAPGIMHLAVVGVFIQAAEFRSGIDPVAGLETRLVLCFSHKAELR
jgi:hypothetical protein